MHCGCAQCGSTDTDQCSPRSEAARLIALSTDGVAMQRVLVAIDGSDGADRALTTAAQLAKKNEAELLIVNVEQGYLSENAEAIRQADGATLDAILFTASDDILKRAQ